MRLATIGLVSSIVFATVACGSSPDVPRPAPAAATAKTLAVFSASTTAKQKLGVDKWVIWVTAKGTLVYEGVDAKRHHVSHLSFRIGRDESGGSRTYNLGWQSVPAKKKGVARFRSDRTAIVDAMPSAVVKWTQVAQKDLAAFKKRGGKLSYGCASDVLATMAGVVGSIATCNPFSEVLSLGSATLVCGAAVLGTAAGAVGIYEDCFPQSSSSSSSSSGDSESGGTSSSGSDTGSGTGEDNGSGTGDDTSTDTSGDTGGGDTSGDTGGDMGGGTDTGGDTGGDMSGDTGGDTSGDTGGGYGDDTGGGYGGDTGGDYGGGEDPGTDYGGDSGGESFDV